MTTYIIYSFILIGTTISAYLYEKATKEHFKIIFYIVSFFIPFFFLAIRYDIGTDYHNYVEYFYRINSGEEIKKEIAYIYINKFIGDFNLNVQWLFIFFGFFFMFFSYKSFPKDGFALSVFFFIVIVYLYEGFSAIRQGLAVAIMAYASKYIYKKEFSKYFLWSLIAMTFHLIAGFLLLIVYPFINRKYNKYILLCFIILFFVIFRFTNLHEILLLNIGALFPKYEWYLHSKYMQPSQISSGFGMMLKVFIALLVVFYKDKIVKKYQQANIMINMYMIYIFFMLLRLKIMIFGRVEHIFIYSQIFVIVYFINIFKFRSKILVSTLILGIYFVIYLKYISTGTNKEDNFINPYQTIIGEFRNENRFCNYLG